MQETIIQFLFFGAIEASFMEVLKKKIFGDGTSTNLPSWLIKLIAIVVALMFAVAMSISNDLGVGWFIIFIYWTGMYALQYALSMKVIKRLLRKWGGV